MAKHNYQDIVSRVQQGRAGLATTNRTSRIVPQQPQAQPHSSGRDMAHGDQLQKRMAVGGYYSNIV